MLKRLLMTASIAVTVALGGARADITVDNFKLPDPATDYLLLGSQSSQVVDTGTTVINNNNRTITVTQSPLQFNGSNGQVGTTTGAYNGGSFSMNTGTGITGTSTLNYNLSAALQDLSGDATAKLRFTVVSSDHVNVPYTLTLNGVSVSGVIASTVTTADPAIVVAVNLSSFAGVDLSNLSTLSLALNKGSSASVSDEDIRITNISFTHRTRIDPPVPAPAAAGLLIAGLPVLGLARVLRRKTA